MHGLAKGLEGLLGAKPVPPAPRIVCGMPPACHATVTRLPVRSPRAEPRTDHSARGPDVRQTGGQVVRLPVRPRKPVFVTSVSRATEPRLVRL
jgi:hypothetical protein